MIYIHVPYCKQRCLYCAFYSVATRSSIQPYVDALCNEIALRKNYLKHSQIRTIYFGGGTPSLLTAAQIMQVKQTIGQYFDISNLEEVTLEANPEQLTDEYLSELKKTDFINRLSIGVQSFNDADLKLLNRWHTGVQAESVVKKAKEYGFENISIDLIYALPNLGVDGWMNNLQKVEELGVSHLSCYSLTVEEGTMLDTLINKGKLSQVDEEMSIKHYELLVHWAKDNGYIHYEVSNLCKQNCEAKHNSRYWNSTPYLGVGAAAHSYDGFSRQWNIDNVDRYIYDLQHDIVPYEREELEERDTYNEYLMTALRTLKGLDKDVLETKYPSLWKDTEIVLKKYVDQGLLQKTNSGYSPTSKGYLFADAIAADLMI